MSASEQHGCNRWRTSTRGESQRVLDKLQVVAASDTHCVCDIARLSSISSSQVTSGSCLVVERAGAAAETPSLRRSYLHTRPLETALLPNEHYSCWLTYCVSCGRALKLAASPSERAACYKSSAACHLDYARLKEHDHGNFEQVHLLQPVTWCLLLFEAVNRS